MKNVNYNKLKKINGLNRFDIGKILSSGYLRANNSVIENTTEDALYNADSDARAIRLTILPSVLMRGGLFAAQYGSDVANGLKYAFKPSQYYIDTAALGTAGSTSISGVNLAAGQGGQITTNVALGTTSGGSGSLGGALGTAAGVAGALYGGFNTINDVMGFKDRLGNSDLEAMSSKNTQTINGVSHTTYGGFDEGAALRYTNAQNDALSVGLTLDAAGTGASIGGLVGSLFTPAGSLIGAGLGAVVGGLGGLVGSIFGSKHRKRRVLQAINRTKQAQAGYNTMSESEAGSQALRNEFYGTRTADMGKDAFIGSTDVKGLMSKDEAWINKRTGETGYPGSDDPNVKDLRADVVPVGGDDFDDIAILGHKKDKFMKYMTGVDINFADETRFAAKENERLKRKINKIKNGKGDNATKSVNIKNIQRLIDKNTKFISDAADRQYAQDYDCGKSVRKFDLGYNPALIQAGMSLPYLLSEKIAADSLSPYAASSYSPNMQSQAAINMMMLNRIDPTYALNQTINSARQGAYNINQSGGLSSALKAMLNLSNQRQLAEQRSDIYDKAQLQNNAYRSDVAKAMMEAGEREAGRMLASRESQMKRYAEAVGAKQRLQAQNRKNWYLGMRQALQDYDSLMRYNLMMNLYNADINSRKRN